MRYVVQNIIEAATAGWFDAILHQTNCMHLWNSGLAPQIRDTWREAFAADLLTPHGDISKLGTCSVATFTANNNGKCMIVNCYGQYKNCSAGGTTDYEALRKALETATTLLPKGSRIGLPKIGCGAAKGDWNIVSKIIEEVFQDYHVVICVLNKMEIPVDGAV